MKKYLIPIIIIFASNLFCITIPPMHPQLNIFGYLGASKTFNKIDVPDYNLYFDSIKPKFGLDAKLTAQMGFNTIINDNFSISSLFEIGYTLYSLDTEYKLKENYGAFIYRFKFLINTLSLGIIEKYNYKKLSIGLGAGVLIPISANQSSNMDDNLYYKMDGNNIYITTIISMKEKFNYQDLKKLFKVPFAPYIKLTAEYEVYSVKEQNLEAGIVLGVYLNYDFGMRYDNIYNKYSFSNLDFGITFGTSIKVNQ